MKKKVIAYLHTHWDREWYREFEVFRLRMVRVLDNVLDLLESGKIPSFYFDGQTSALEDYLELNPEKEIIIKKLIKEKKFFIGPCYTLVDEFLTDVVSFRKNLEIGLNYSKKIGCKDFLGYFADTFGHSKNIPIILKEFGIDKAVVWRGCNDKIPSEFIFNGVDTVNLVRGYFMDIFSSKISIEEKAKFLESHLDKIAQKSSNTLLMPIGADHLGIEPDILNQIKEVNKVLKGYEIELSSPFKYFELVKNNFKLEYNGELRDNSTTFILQGSYSARIKLKQLNSECSYRLDLANQFQKYSQKKYMTKSYDSIVEYAYKLLLQNQAHDGICGCSTDAVHQENIVRYQKILQIANTIIEELKLELCKKPLIVNLSQNDYRGILEFESSEKLSKKDFQLISKRKGFENELLYDTQRIPVTEDFKNIYTYLTEIENKPPSKPLAHNQKVSVGILSASDLNVTEKLLENSKLAISIEKGKMSMTNKLTGEVFDNFIEFVDYKDHGDTYNFGPVVGDNGVTSKIMSSKVLRKGPLQCAILVKFKVNGSILDVEIALKKEFDLVKFTVNWNNTHKNHLLQVKFNLKKAVTETFSEDMNTLIRREFDADYDIRKNLPEVKGIEAKTNTAPMGRYVATQGFCVVTRGLREYEVSKNSLLITILRATGIISNPTNPARSTPAGPPIEVEGAQQLGANEVVFAIGFAQAENWHKAVDKVYPYLVTNI